MEAHSWPSGPPHCASKFSRSAQPIAAPNLTAGGHRSGDEQASERARERETGGRETAANRGLRGRRHHRGPVGTVPHARGEFQRLGHRPRRVRRERYADVAVCARPDGVLRDEEPGE